MTFFTQAQLEQLLINGKPENKDKDHIPVVKLLLPHTPAAWLLTQINPDAPHLAFGLCDIGAGRPEIGYVDLRDLEELKAAGIYSVVRDWHFEGKFPLSIYARTAKYYRAITTDEQKLQAQGGFLL